MIRAARAADAARLVELFAELGYPDAGDGLADRLERAPGQTMVADVDGRVMGLVTLAFTDVIHEPGRWCRITALVVAEDMRGQGVGSALVVAAENVARAAGCSRIEATSRASRTDAHASYTAWGYARDSQHFVKRL